MAEPLKEDTTALPQSALPPTNGDAQNGPRRTSFNFLRKSSSGSRGRSVSGGKMSKKQKALAQEEALRKQREAAMRQPPPRLPNHSPLPQIDHFGGDERPDSVAIVSNRASNHPHNFSRPSIDHKMAPSANTNTSAPAQSVPGASPAYMDYDPYPHTESMTHRGRYSYASSAISTVAVNSPRRVRRRKDPTPFKSVLLPRPRC